ncbi:MAG TPA: hypothetical protein VJV78_09260 [Polyangiales bacterium]|nr:hypothetical protein [Polyangiales bacterium]
MSTREQPIRQRPQRKEVRSLIEWQPAQCLGRHAGRRAYELRRVSEGRQRAEVDQLDAAVASQPNVAWRNVTVHEPVAVDQRERRRDIAQVFACVVDRRRRALLQVAAVQQLHGVVGAVLGQTIVVYLDDARVLEPQQRVVLALEQRLEHAALAAERGRGESLQRDHAARD